MSYRFTDWPANSHNSPRSGIDSNPDPSLTPTLPIAAASRGDSRRRISFQTASQPLRPEYHSAPDWHIPIYGATNADVAGEFPFRRVSQIPVGPHDERRGSGESDVTLNDEQRQLKKFSLSSYQHPCEIVPPSNAYPSPRPATQPHPLRASVQHDAHPSDNYHIPEHQTEESKDDQHLDVASHERELKRRGILSNYLELLALSHWDTDGDDIEKPQGSTRPQFSRGDSEYSPGYTRLPPNVWRSDSMASTASAGSDMLDPDDPHVTGIAKKCLDDPEDLEKNTLRQMDYKARRKERQRIKIEFNICCMLLVPPCSALSEFFIL